MGLVDRVKQNISDTVELAREGVDQVNDFREKREVTHLYGDLGKRVFELVEKGELELPAACDGDLKEILRTLAEREYIKGTGSSRPAGGGAGEAGQTAPTRDDI